MRYADLPVPPALALWLADLWEFTADEGVVPGFAHRVIPDGAISLAATPGGLVLVGPRTAAFTVPLQPGVRFRGIRFRPDAAGNLLHLEPARLRNAMLPLGAPAHPWAADLARGLRSAASDGEAAAAVTRALAPLAAGARPLDVAIRHGVALLEVPGARVAEVAAAAGLGPRQFQRRFVRAVGLPPKAFARVRRLRQAIGRLLDAPPAGWARIAAELGYADQAHLVRDAARVTGLPPTGIAEYVRAIAHGPVRP